MITLYDINGVKRNFEPEFVFRVLDEVMTARRLSVDIKRNAMCLLRNNPSTSTAALPHYSKYETIYKMRIAIQNNAGGLYDDCEI